MQTPCFTIVSLPIFYRANRSLKTDHFKLQLRENYMSEIQNLSHNPLRIARLKCNFGIAESLGNIIIWIILSIVTIGIALLFFPYFLNKSVLNKTVVLGAKGEPIGYLNCKYSVASSIGNAILWSILIFFTLGIASFFYVYRVVRVVLNETYIEFY